MSHFALQQIHKNWLGGGRGGGLGQGRERENAWTVILLQKGTEPLFWGEGESKPWGGRSSSSSPGPQGTGRRAPTPQQAHTRPPHSALERGQPEDSSSGQAQARTPSPQGFGTPVPSKPIAKPNKQAELMYSITAWRALGSYQHASGNSSSRPQDPRVSCPGTQQIPLLMPQKTHCCLHLSSSSSLQSRVSQKQEVGQGKVPPLHRAEMTKTHPKVPIPSWGRMTQGPLLAQLLRGAGELEACKSLQTDIRIAIYVSISGPKGAFPSKRQLGFLVFFLERISLLIQEVPSEVKKLPR